MTVSPGEIVREQRGQVHFCGSTTGAIPVRKGRTSQTPLGQNARVRQPRCSNGRRAEDSTQKPVTQCLRFSAPRTPRPGPHATACAPRGARRTRGRVLHSRRVERGPPALLVIPRELEIVALARHPDHNPSRCRTRSRATSAAPRGHGHTTAWEERRSRVLL